MHRELGRSAARKRPQKSDEAVLPVDTRPRTVVKTLNGIECERTYYVYSPLTNIVERVGTQGAAYGGTNVLRTVTTFYPVGGESDSGNVGLVGSSVPLDRRAGFVQSIRHEDGTFDTYDYSLVSNLWTRTITHLDEQYPTPVSGKTTRDITTTNHRGEILEQKTDAYIDGVWYIIARETMTYNPQGKRITSENLAGQVTTTAWDCCHKVSETQPDGSTTTWDYDVEGRMIASSRLIPLDMTNVTWLTTCYEYDGLGRQTATWQTNYAAQVGLPVTYTAYDSLGRVVSRTDRLGNAATKSYRPDGRSVTVETPNGATHTSLQSASGDMISVTGTAVIPNFHAYSVTNLAVKMALSPSTAVTIPCRVHTIRYGSEESPRFTRSYVNMLGRTVREDRVGYKGTILVSTYEYDAYGRLSRIVADYKPTIEYVYDSTGVRAAVVNSVDDGQWRRKDTAFSYALHDGAVWLSETNTVSCSDATIAPLVSTFARQITGFATNVLSCSRFTDVRGGVTESGLFAVGPFVARYNVFPFATNKTLAVYRCGSELQEVSLSAVTNSYAYDKLGRLAAAIDGRGNVTRTEYNAFGLKVAKIDALGTRTSYAYNQYGIVAAITNALGVAAEFEYDLRGRMTLEHGNAYPVRYTYNVFGARTSMTTYRNGFTPESPDSGDVTIWLYDEISGALTNKVYADGNGISYDYTPDGRIARRTWARGVTADYSYDSWGNAVNVAYSDGTPSVTQVYDAMGHQISATDAAGTTTFDYDAFGGMVREEVQGLYSKIMEWHFDDFGRGVGYTIDGTRATQIEYEADTGRVHGMKSGGVWLYNSYLPGTDLRSSIKYGESGHAYYSYEPKRELLAQVRNEFNGEIISQYDYANDAIGRRVEMSRAGSAMSECRMDTYGYNFRDELVSAVKNAGADEYRYAYDDIGRRMSANMFVQGV